MHPYNRILMDSNGLICALVMHKMVLEWREREHEDMDREAMWDAPTLQALQQSDLLKFYCTSNMRAQVHLLETLVDYWDHELGLFDL